MPYEEREEEGSTRYGDGGEWDKEVLNSVRHGGYLAGWHRGRVEPMTFQAVRVVVFDDLWHDSGRTAQELLEWRGFAFSGDGGSCKIWKWYLQEESVAFIWLNAQPKEWKHHANLILLVLSPFFWPWRMHRPRCHPEEQEWRDPGTTSNQYGPFVFTQINAKIGSTPGSSTCSSPPTTQITECPSSRRWCRSPLSQTADKWSVKNGLKMDIGQHNDVRKLEAYLTLLRPDYFARGSKFMGDC